MLFIHYKDSQRGTFKGSLEREFCRVNYTEGKWIFFLPVSVLYNASLRLLRFVSTAARLFIGLHSQVKEHFTIINTVHVST